MRDICTPPVEFRVKKGNKRGGTREKNEAKEQHKERTQFNIVHAWFRALCFTVGKCVA